MAYPIGTVVIGQNMTAPHSLKRNGMEGVIVGGLELRTGRIVPTGALTQEYRYLVRWADRTITQVKPPKLRKKQPPSGEHRVLEMFTAPAPQQLELNPVN